MKKNRVLIIKPSSFGDIVQANPTLVALQEAYPGVEVSWLVFDRFAGLVSLFPGISRVMVWRKEGGIREYGRIISLLRRERFDLVVDLQGLARTSFLSIFSGARQRIGTPGMKEMSWLLTREAFPESRTLGAVERSLEVVRYLTGKKPDVRFELMIDDIITGKADEVLRGAGIDAPGLLVGLVPSARGRHKIWPAEHYRELADLIMSSFPNAVIVALGSAGDKGVVKHPNVVDLCGKTGVGELAGILKKCGVVVGGDTGPVHLAAALDIPVIALFGGSDVRETAPVNPKAMVLKKDFDCSPCRSRPVCKDFPCLREIRPEEVFVPLEKILLSR